MLLLPALNSYDALISVEISAEVIKGTPTSNEVPTVTEAPAV